MKFCMFSLLNLFFVTNAFLNGFKSKLVQKKYNNDDISIYKNPSIESKDTPSILFFTGLNSIIPGYIYDDFLKTVSDKNITCYVATNNIETNDELIDDIVETHSNLTIMGHSSGCITAAKSIDKNLNIKSIIFMDPVDNSFVFDKFTKPNLNHIEDILVVNAKRSYEWQWTDTLPKVPFIPAFKMTSDSIKLKSPRITLLTADDYGHTDILNKPWTDIMHKSVSRGSDDRANKNLKKYRHWLASCIYNFIYKNSTLNSLSNSQDLDSTKIW